MAHPAKYFFKTGLKGRNIGQTPQFSMQRKKQKNQRARG
jgi:hypothetical protein